MHKNDHLREFMGKHYHDGTVHKWYLRCNYGYHYRSLSFEPQRLRPAEVAIEMMIIFALSATLAIKLSLAIFAVLRPISHTVISV